MEHRVSQPDLKKEIYIKELTKADIPKWEKYVNENPCATFYHRIEWKEIIEKSFGHKTYYLIALQPSKSTNSSTAAPQHETFNSQLVTCNSEPVTRNPQLVTEDSCTLRDSERVVGILPLVHIKSLIFGSIFCSMPFLNLGGVCADNSEAEGLLLREAENILRDKKGDYLELRHLQPSSANLQRKSHKVSMTLELNSDPDVLWKKFTTKHRTSVRRAGKNELEVKVGKRDLLQDFYLIMCRGWRDLGTPFYPFSFFSNIMDRLEDSLEIYVVLHEGKPIATAFNGLYKDTVEGMWASSVREYVKLQANYFLYWEMIQRACLQGYKWYHLGRSTAESGGEFYKEKWNAIPKPLNWEYILNRSKEIPELNVQNPKYQFAIRTWRRLPLPVTRVVGPILAKNIP
ncbi:MAG: FemAB family PEP-CTERM system-associated protein [Deltaproteobacteria bacterium]|nr:FemAB family PEP-CTERM system-associated protein [Deltaproteobacteria bacterium]